jgi:hypothetical protein
MHRKLILDLVMWLNTKEKKERKEDESQEVKHKKGG